MWIRLFLLVGVLGVEGCALRPIPFRMELGEREPVVAPPPTVPCVVEAGVVLERRCPLGRR